MVLFFFRSFFPLVLVIVYVQFLLSFLPFFLFFSLHIYFY